MRRQRNMAQVKEQIKTPEKELNKMDIGNLSDAGFKTLVIRMLKELSEDFSSIKKIQSEMGDTLIERKNNLQGNNHSGCPSSRLHHYVTHALCQLLCSCLCELGVPSLSLLMAFCISFCALFFLEGPLWCAHPAAFSIYSNLSKYSATHHFKKHPI